MDHFTSILMVTSGILMILVFIFASAWRKGEPFKIFLTYLAVFLTLVLALAYWVAAICLIVFGIL